MVRSKFTTFRPVIKSRHPSHAELRSKNGKKLPLLPFKSVIRFGSKTEMIDTIAKGGQRVELNTVSSIANSANKLAMKRCFHEGGVVTANWWIARKQEDGTIKYFQNENEEAVGIDELSFPIISKHVYGSRGVGNRKHDTKESLEDFISKRNDISKYIFEKYYTYNREYRLHVTEDGCFYTCRKMLKSNTEDNKRWYRNNDNSVWLLDTNPSFDKPVNWDKIVTESIKALKAVGLDFGAIDLRIQSSKNKDGEVRKDPKFIIIEINSAPSFGDVTKLKYIEQIPKLLIKKWKTKKVL